MCHNHIKVIILFLLASPSLSHAMEAPDIPQTREEPARAFAGRMWGQKHAVCPFTCLCTAGWFLLFARQVSGFFEPDATTFGRDLGISCCVGIAMAVDHYADYEAAQNVAQEMTENDLDRVLNDPELEKYLNKKHVAAIHAELERREQANLQWRQKYL